MDIAILETGVCYCTITGANPMGWGSSGRKGRDTLDSLCLAVCLAIYDAILKVKKNADNDADSRALA